jgi:hypothetical protein
LPLAAFQEFCENLGNVPTNRTEKRIPYKSKDNSPIITRVFANLKTVDAKQLSQRNIKERISQIMINGRPSPNRNLIMGHTHCD